VRVEGELELSGPARRLDRIPSGTSKRGPASTRIDGVCMA
jgi:hypothetical protein